MDERYSKRFAETEESYWWSVARSNDILREVRRLDLPRDTRVLIVGSAGGYQIRRLSRHFDSIIGGDLDFAMLASSRRHSGDPVVQFDGARLPFPEDSFDLIVASDVLEHIEDDTGAMLDWTRVLRTGGHLLIYVPAWPFLFGPIDQASHHHRRYRPDQLKQLASTTGLQVLWRRPWNSLLLIPASAAMLLRKILPRSSSAEDLRNLPSPINALMTLLIDIESRLGRFRRDPFGLSHALLARKTAT